MPLAADALRRQPGRVRKALRKLRKDSSPDAVHKTRTRMRRLEAIVSALGLNSRKNERCLVAVLKPVRRKAGRVRDMDVLTRFASLPRLRGEEQCSIQLLEHLGAVRERQARKLENRIRADYPQIRRRLKKCAALLDTTLQQNGRHNLRLKKWGERATSLALQLEGELRDWPALNRTNLHPFRLKVKKLRYVLQMAEGEDRFVASLGEVKDKIGEWHDWQELSKIAKQLIKHPGCKLSHEIDSNARERFEGAIAAANELRQQYLRPEPHKGRQSPNRPSAAIYSASELAA